ncbi:MAG: TetR/AcrR family transcriptional regulator [Ilumatobacteraceae bacterium]
MASGKVSVRAKASMPSAPSPVTARGARTRAALVKAARALFEKNGYLDTNVGDIARRARVAHGTFYTYFNSKEDIFIEVAENLLADFQRIASEEPTVADHGAISERIERANRGYIHAYQANARMMAVLEQVSTFNPRLAQMRRTMRSFWRQRNSEAIARWQERGLVSRDIDADYAASALGSMIDRSAYVWIVLGEPYDVETAVEQLTRLYCNALGLPYRGHDPV